MIRCFSGSCLDVQWRDLFFFVCVMAFLDILSLKQASDIRVKKINKEKRKLNILSAVLGYDTN